MKNIVLLVLLFLSLLSCEKGPSELQLANKYDNFDFSPYKGKSIYVRDFESKNILIVFLEYFENKHLIRNVIKYDKEKKAIIKDEKSLVTKSSTPIDISINDHKKIVEDFVDMDIYCLKVDSLGNVIVILKAGENSPVVGKFINEDFKNKILPKSKKIKNNWFISE